MKPSQDVMVPLSAATGVGVRVVALLALAAFINYVDRGNLATAGPLIRDELALSNAQLGMLSIRPYALTVSDRFIVLAIDHPDAEAEDHKQ
jgi:hypothetical protein